MDNQTPYRKKLIEVDLPLDDINRECVRERPQWRNHHSTLHRWWARRPVVACRAVIFASLVDDPSTYLDEPHAQEKREKLHDIISELVKWENTNNENVLAKARYEIACSVARSHGETVPTSVEAVLRYLAEKVPTVYDPFCGSASIPLEAQRLGLCARASDLNPIAVLLNKALIEIPPAFHNQPPIKPDADSLEGWRGTSGLAADIRYYGHWMRDEAYKRIGHFYPKAKLSGGTEATVIAWLWAHTVQCANPACGLPMPLVHSFQLSKKRGNRHWTRPIVDTKSKTISFIVQNHNTGVPDKGTVKNKTEAVCVTCRSPVKLEYVREQARKGKMSIVMTAIVAQGEQGKLFLSPIDTHDQVARSATPNWKPTSKLPEDPLGFSLQNYGITYWHQLFTERQLTTLTTFSDLMPKARDRMIQDGATETYADSLCTYLACAIGKTVDIGCRGTRWRVDSNTERIVHAISKQAIHIAWDFAEANPFSFPPDSSANWITQVNHIANVVEHLPVTTNSSEVYQADAATTTYAADSPIIITDPPYYDIIGYADLSDFFYAWLRPLLRDIYPELFAGISTPKTEEIVANRHRFENSREHFENLLHKTLQRIREHCSDQFPTSIFYAYRQQENKQNTGTSTAWETILSAVISAGLQIVATWPMRTENTTSPTSIGKNALASSIVLVCRPRPDTAQNINLGGFLTALRTEMPVALDRLTWETHIAPVDLAQAAIGPGMEIYSRYKNVKTTRDGELIDLSVREALIKINEEIDRYHAEQEGEFDSHTRFCLAWFKTHGFNAADYGSADVLAKANVVTIDSMRGRVLTAERGKVELLPLKAYDDNHPNAQLSLLRITTWEACHLMVYHLNPRNEDGRGIEGAVEVGTAMQNSPTSDPVASVERLARILYSHYDRQGNAENAFLFNTLVTSWNTIEENIRNPEQGQLDLDMDK